MNLVDRRTDVDGLISNCQGLAVPSPNSRSLVWDYPFLPIAFINSDDGLLWKVSVCQLSIVRPPAKPLI
jgi:hypothetical protein